MVFSIQETENLAEYDMNLMQVGVGKFFTGPFSHPFHSFQPHKKIPIRILGKSGCRHPVKRADNMLFRNGMGRKFALTTIVSTFVYPIALGFFEKLFGNLVLTQDLFLCTIFSGLGIGFSLGIVIRAGASTGGMDIPPLVLNHYLKIPVSISMYVFDFCILLVQAVGNPPEKVLYGLILVMTYTLVLDKLMLMGTTRTEVRIVSKHAQKIREAIISEMDRGVTMLSGETGYLKHQTQMIFSVISNRELPRLEKLIHAIDPESFMVVNRVSEVSGRGFSMKQRYR